MYICKAKGREQVSGAEHEEARERAKSDVAAWTSTRFPAPEVPYTPSSHSPTHSLDTLQHTLQRTLCTLSTLCH